MFILILIILLLLSNNLNAATYNASSCSSADVQTALNLAISEGDIVVLPSCPTQEAWTSGVTVASTNAITIQGAGKTSTVLTSNPGGLYLIDIGYSGSEVRDIGFKEGGILIGSQVVAGTWKSFKIHGCDFTNTALVGASCPVGVYVSALTYSGETTGVVYNNTFSLSRAVVGGLTLTYDTGWIWSQALNLGTANAVYFEGNTVENSNFAQCNWPDTTNGNRIVIRYNTINNISMLAHDAEVPGRRGARSWEVYNNAWTGSDYFTFLRAGTGIVANNTFSGSSTTPMRLNNARSDSGGPCDGTTSDGIDGNTEPIETYRGYPCRDQIGRSFDNPAWTYPGGGSYTQVLDPAYEWNNCKTSLGCANGGANDISFTVTGTGYNSTHIVENRDFYNNTQKAGYNPYTCPHPLTGLTSTCDTSIAGASGYIPTKRTIFRP